MVRSRLLKAMSQCPLTRRNDAVSMLEESARMALLSPDGLKRWQIHW